MRDQIDAEIWNTHHDQFSEWIGAVFGQASAGEKVLVQERLFLAEQLGGPFDLEHPEVHLGPRQEISDEGLRISQWTVALRDVAAFVERRRRSSVPA